VLPPQGPPPSEAAILTPDASVLAVEGAELVAVDQPPADAGPGFRERARLRRRLRYLRRLRELLFRDLGGLTFDLHRFGRDRPDLVEEKLGALAGVDAELRTIETALGDRRPLHELREAGISACPRCGTLHDTDASFCPSCGTSLRGGDPAPAPAATDGAPEHQAEVVPAGAEDPQHPQPGTPGTPAS
jgi:hypothetical protein